MLINVDQHIEAFHLPELTNPDLNLSSMLIIKIT